MKERDFESRASANSATPAWYYQVIGIDTYVGSITIDKDILDAVDILANEKVAIVNNNNGARFETYVIEGERGSGKICLNGAASRLVEVDDVVIIMTYARA